MTSLEPDPGSLRRTERLGVFGGTFDPPHCGHVAVAEACVGAFGLDRLLMVVANDPYLKSSVGTVTPAEDRFAMVETAVSGLGPVTASRMEIDRGGPSHTVETVEALAAGSRRRGHPTPEIFLVVGADLVSQLPAWERVSDLVAAVTLVVVNRPGAAARPPLPGWRATLLEVPEMAVSSSEVRQRLAEGRSVEGLVPEAVVRCIGRRSLYAVRR